MRRPRTRFKAIDYGAAAILAADFIVESERRNRCGVRRVRALSKSSVDLLPPAHDICVLVQRADVRNAREYRGPSCALCPALTLPSRMLASARPSILTCKTS